MIYEKEESKRWISIPKNPFSNKLVLTFLSYEEQRMIESLNSFPYAKESVSYGTIIGICFKDMEFYKKYSLGDIIMYDLSNYKEDVFVVKYTIDEIEFNAEIHVNDSAILEVIDDNYLIKQN